jgi:catechol 2,3-dioxygenase-like lactoylglutathione lyase family enzyme
MIKVLDIAYARFAAPDLDAMERFAEDFGLKVTARAEDSLYCRGTDPSPYLHVTERGDSAFRGIAFEAASAEDLTAAAQLEGASPIEKIEAPGGGQRVRFLDPDGYGVEVVHGRELLKPLPVRGAAPLNRGSDRRRLGSLQRVEAGPACVKRLGHAGLRVSDFRRSEQWYKSKFGFVASDEIYLGEPDNRIAAFLRCDRGQVHTDHHTLVCIGVPGGDVGLDHVAFEVEDFDAVMLGHDHLKQAGYEHKSGVGRHVLGAQVYDYWFDPWNNVHEHFTDGDLLNDRHETGVHDPASALGSQWGSLTP